MTGPLLDRADRILPLEALGDRIALETSNVALKPLPDAVVEPNCARLIGQIIDARLGETTTL
jgi:hypothetical protein